MLRVGTSFKRVHLWKHKWFVELTLSLNQKKYADAKEWLHRLDAYFPCHRLDVMSFLFEQLSRDYDNNALRIVVADFCMNIGWYAESFLLLEEALDLNGRETMAYDSLAKLYGKNHDKEAIKHLFESAFNLGIINTAICDLLPGMYVDSHDVDSNILFYQKMLALYPLEGHFKKTLCTLYEKSGAYQDAAVLYDELTIGQPAGTVLEMACHCDRLSEKDPANTSIRYIAIRLHTKSYHPAGLVMHVEALLQMDKAFVSEALCLYKNMQTLCPDTLDVLLGLARILIALQQYSEAISHLKRCVQLYGPSDSVEELLMQILDQYPQQVWALQLVTEMAIDQKKYTKILHMLSRLVHHKQCAQLRLDAIFDRLIPGANEYQLYAKLLHMYYQYHTEAFDGCKNQCKALYGTMYDGIARIWYAKSLFRQGEVQKAREELNTMVQAFGQDIAWHELFQMLHGEKIECYFLQEKQSHFREVHQVLSVYWDAVLGHPVLVKIPFFEKNKTGPVQVGFGETYCQEGIEMAMRGCMSDAAKKMEDALDLDPSNERILLNLALIKGVLGSIHPARTYINQIQKNTINQEYVALNLGIVLMLDHDMDTAISALSQIPHQSPIFMWTHYHVAVANQFKKEAL